MEKVPVGLSQMVHRDQHTVEREDQDRHGIAVTGYKDFHQHIRHSQECSLRFP
mgnify:CR=1 FL=1